MSAPYLPNHAALALARLTSQFANKPNLAGLLNAHSAQYQAIEDAINQIVTLRPFGPLCGTDALNHWGRSVGQPRPKTGLASTDDPTFYAQVLARVIVNNSNGTVENLNALLRAIGATYAQYYEPAPATAWFNYTGTLVVDDATFRNFMVLASPSVALGMTQYTAPPFGFAGNPIAAGFNRGQLSRNVP
jgi:hypothetical protein